MPAPDVATKTTVEIQEAAMSVLIEALGGDDDSNIADALSAHKINWVQKSSQKHSSCNSVLLLNARVWWIPDSEFPLAASKDQHTRLTQRGFASS